MKNNIYILFICSLLMGCTFNSRPPIEIYTLSPNWDENQSSSHKAINPKTIKIATIRASQSLTSNDILYSRKQFTQNSYLYSHWNDSPIKLLQIIFQNTLEKNRLYKAVIPSTSIVKTDLILESILLDLNHQVDNKSTSYGIIRVHFYLVNNTSKKIIASKEFAAKIPAESQSAQGAVEALNKATRIISHQLTDWLEQLKSV